MTQPDASDYRLAPALVARILGACLVGLALLVLAATVLLAAAGWPVGLLVVLVAVGLVALLAIAWWLRARAYVVRFAADGYRVGLVRGAGVRRAAWTEVREAGTTAAGGAPYVVLQLRDERSTTIPVAALAIDRDQFVRELRTHLQRGHGRREL